MLKEIHGTRYWGRNANKAISFHGDVFLRVFQNFKNCIQYASLGSYRWIMDKIKKVKPKSGSEIHVKISKKNLVGGGVGAGDYCTVTKVGDCGSRTKIEQFWNLGVYGCFTMYFLQSTQEKL